MSNRPLVTVVIPTRNRQAVLSRCLDALAEQTYRPYEIIVVDDASSDDTPQYLDKFASDHPDTDFRWHRNEPQAGANPSRNRAIRAARGQFVAFLDDDCIPAPEWLERLMATFVSDRVAAVTGRVDDPEPTNIFELAHKGTHRVYGGTHATRLVAGNMCVRRDVLAEYMLDEDRAGVASDMTVSGRGDEDGLFLSLRAAGYEQRVAHDAVVLHDHHRSGRTFFRQAYRGGVATARLGYKYYLRPRIELVPLALAYLSLPLLGLGAIWALVPAAFASIFLAAILYNDLFRKRKTVFQTLITLPLMVAFFHLRLIGYVSEHIRIRLGRTTIRRVRLPKARQAR